MRAGAALRRPAQPPPGADAGLLPGPACSHEEATDGHEMKWATRMVCGYCSTEQALAPACKSCGKKLATSAGAGCVAWGGVSWTGLGRSARLPARRPLVVSSDPPEL